MSPALRLLLATLALLAVPLRAGAGEASPAPSRAAAKERSDETRFPSRHLGGEIVTLPGVFPPIEAEALVLPLLAENADLFKGKRVLEIGSGSGIVSVYAAKLGAAKVVSTDIDPNAVASTRRNAERFGVGAIVEARLVPPDDISAYSVLEPGETFDVIISNPPYSLDLDATKNDPLVDKGDLGFSIVRGLDERLAPGGRAILLYGSLFYHLAMVKFARHSGFEVRYHPPLGLTAWEAKALFNTYLARFLKQQGLDPTAFRFTDREPGAIMEAEDAARTKSRKPLFPGSGGFHPGTMVIERKGTADSKAGGQNPWEPKSVTAPPSMRARGSTTRPSLGHFLETSNADVTEP